jgi:eukaryotic-like serine/threonine-protein kinase
MGEVFRAYDRVSRQTVALKRVMLSQQNQFNLASPEAPSRTMSLSFAEEFKTLASLRHPNVISVLDYGFDNQRQPYFTMALLEDAQTLTGFGQTQPLRVKIDLLIQVLQALAYMHRLSILHCDLKPDNVLVVNGQVKVLDFGLAITRSKNTTLADGNTAGTLAYMAPEVIQGFPTSEVSDLYAVGVMAYELLAGVHPFKADSLTELITHILTQEPDMSLIEVEETALSNVDDSIISTKLIAVLQRWLAKDPLERYADAYELIAVLNTVLDRPPSTESNAIRESFLQGARLVGRDTELEKLEGSMRQLTDPSVLHGNAWLIRGESGIGKSKLLEAVRIRGLVSGALVLRGQATDGGAAYQLWCDVLRRLLLTVEISDLEAGILKEILPDIGVLLEREVPNAPEVDGDVRGQRLLLTVEAVFRRQTSPILLLLEDLHWANDDIELLRRLTHLTPSLPLLIVASYRDDEQRQLSDQLPEMQVMKLSRLNIGEIAELSETILGIKGRQPEVVQLLERETEGNAFFLVEVVRVLAESAGRLQDVGQTTLPAMVFAGGIQTVVRHRLSRVPESARSLLQLAAVAGRLLDLSIIRSMAEEIHIDVEDWLTTCANAAVLDVQDEQWRFAHDKLRESLLADVPENARPALHRQVAQAIERTGGAHEAQAGALLEHWAQAGDTGKQAHYAAIAGDLAARISAFGQALALYNRALALLPENSNNPERLSLLLRTGETYRQLGQFSEAGQYLELALTLAHQRDLDAEAEALYQLSQVAVGIGNLTRANQRLTESLALARNTADSALLARVLYGLGDLAWRKGDLDSALKQVNESLNIARQSNQLTQVLYALNRLGAIYLDTHQHEQARQFYAEGKGLARQIGNRERLAAITMNTGLVDYFEEHYADARASYLEALALAQEVGNQHLIAVNLLNIGDVSLRLHDTEQARNYLHDALALAHHLGAVSLMLVILTNIGALYTQLINMEKALNLLGLARFHPSADANTQQEQARFLKEIEQSLTGDEITAGLERGRQLDFDITVRTMIANRLEFA